MQLVVGVEHSTDTHTNRGTDRDIKAGSLAGRQEGRQAGWQAGRQTDRRMYAVWTQSDVPQEIVAARQRQPGHPG